MTRASQGPRITAVLFGLLILAAPALGRAEIIELLDKTKIAGTIEHYYDGIFVIETGGTKIQMPRDKIRSITFKLPPPRAEFSTPEKTFNRWREAVLQGAMPKVIDCYALMYQGVLAYQLGEDKEVFAKMKKEVEGTRFVVKETKIKGDTAVIKVQRKRGEDSDTGELRFVRENGEWKLLPPM
ncbi:MAG TPA: hypothetical protein VGQ83_01865 [Polyangia bacterium]|jgi:hypothetical protein